MSDSGGSTSKVSFSDDVDVEEAAPVTSRRASDESLDAVKKRVSLSKSAKAWDIDGDGELDDAELALRDMDKTKKGTLSKQQMYSLMQQNINMNGELKKIKKVVIGLVALTCVLAAANIGLSFAAAFLAKDTTTSEGRLVDAKTGDTLKTDTTTTRFGIDPEFNKEYNSSQRRLACAKSETTCPVVNADCNWFESFDPVCYNSNCQYENTGHAGCAGIDAQDLLLVSGTCPDAIGCDFEDVTAVSNADGLAIVAACQSGGAVTIGREYTAGTVDTQICPAASTSYKPNNSDTKTEVKIGTGPSAIEVKPGTSGNYEIINLPLSPDGGLCTVDGDCETGLTCDTSNGSVCASGGSGGGSGETGETICPVSTDPDCACTLQFDPVCHNSVCQYGNDCIAKCAGLKPNQWASGGCS